MAAITLPKPRQSNTGRFAYGQIPDLPDLNDFAYKPPYGALKSIPAKSDLRKVKGYPPCWDQDQLGACTAHGIAGGLVIGGLLNGLTIPMPSRLGIYYGERVIEGTVKSDSGAQIRDGIKVVSHGVLLEEDWAYDITQFTKAPPKSTHGIDVAVTYRRLTRDKKLSQFRACLGVDKKPIVFGFSVYESFEAQTTMDTGIVPMPEAGEQLLGGHCVLAVGHDDTKKMPGASTPGAILCRNSWSPDVYGKLQGHFWLPYDYFRTRALSSDFWEIETDEYDPNTQQIEAPDAE